MENMVNLIQIILDAMLIFLCCEGVFRDKIAQKLQDGLLFLYIFLFCMVARVHVIAGGQPDFFFLTQGFEITPADNLITLLFLMLAVLVLTSVFYQLTDSRYTFCGIMAVFSLYLLTRMVSIVICSMSGVTGTLFLFGFRFLSLLLILLFLYCPARSGLQQMLRNGNFMVGLVATNITGVLLSVLSFVSFNITQFTEHLWKIIAVLVTLLLLDSGILYYQQRKNQEQKRIHMIEQYVPIVEELISQVRARQHAFQNQLFAIESAVYTAETLEEAKQNVAMLTKGTIQNDNDQALLTCDSKIIAGMLYGKIKQAERLELQIQIALYGLFKKSTTPETAWIEIIGILMDNAMEASSSGDTIYLKSRQKENYLELTISNPAAPMSNTEFMHLFQKGVTTKKDQTLHGYGLYNILQMVEQQQGKIITRNEQIGQANYVVFGVILP